MRGKTHLKRLLALRALQKVFMNVAAFARFFRGLQKFPYNAVPAITAHRPNFRPAVAIALQFRRLRPIHSAGASFLTTNLGFHFLKNPFFFDAPLAQRRVVYTL